MTSSSSTFMNLLTISVLVSTACPNVEISSSPSKCHVTSDPHYKDGVCLDCRGRQISSLPLPEHWVVPGITSLLLDDNGIAEVKNGSFVPIESFKSLRCLSLHNNKISTVDEFGFSGLVGLQRLNLERNQIDLRESSLSDSVFRGLSNLSELLLSYNGNDYTEGNYPDSLFMDLTNLRTLSLDTFAKELTFGSLFNNTKKLASLSLSGHVTIITNASFHSFRSIKLKILIIRDVYKLHGTKTDAFGHLKHLTHYTLSGTSQSLEETLESLAPFVHNNNTMEHLEIRNLENQYSVSSTFARNSVMIRHMARHLSELCVVNFYLINVKVFIIEKGVLTSKRWRECLKRADISRNPISGEDADMLVLYTMKRLTHFNLSGRKYVFESNSKGSSKAWRPSACGSVYTTSLLRSETERPKGENLNSPVFETEQQIHDNKKQSTITTALRSLPSTHKGRSLITKYSIDRARSLCSGLNLAKSVRFQVPRNLRYLYANSQRAHLTNFDKNYTFENASKLEEVHLSDNGIGRFTASICGLTNVKLIDFSKNNGSTMSSHFFDTIPSLAHLNMAEMKLDSNFMAINSDRLFQNLANLKSLDLSNNGLDALANRTFSSNGELSVLVLARNRFQTLPIDLLNVPNLCFLDMRHNSIQLLSGRDIARLEAHATINPSFSLSLSGNDFKCGCDGIAFLAWLQRTRIGLDEGGNYTCVLDSGRRSTTGQIRDLEAMWRVCHGQKAFLISLILASLMTLVFLCSILIPKFKTQLKAFILKRLWNPLVLKTSADYPIGVYVGYADPDGRLACHTLRKYIEQELGLTTYIRHRDLLPATDIAEAIMATVHSSWRVLLVVSRHFLEDPWSYFILKAATYAVQPENPGRIVLLLIDSGGDRQALLSNLPSSFLQAVQEESIVTMTCRGNISYEDKQGLKTALSSFGIVAR